jgi:copper chaperone CopZ
MPQMTLFAPDITCDHCIATIKKTVEGIQGAQFITGDPDTRSFVVDLAGGAVLDAVSAALTEEGYPLGQPGAAPAAHSAQQGGMTNVSMDLGPFAPSYTVERSEAGAEITYTCPCGSTTERYQYDRSKTEQDVGSCCDHHLLVGPDAPARLGQLKGDAYAIDVQTVEMPWGQPVQAAFATRRK